MSGWLLILSLLILGGILSTLGDRLGSRVGKARLSLFNMRPRRTAVVITVLTGSLISASLTWLDAFGEPAIAGWTVRTRYSSSTAERQS
jgi:uncharacterized protein (DUF3084 family)